MADKDINIHVRTPGAEESTKQIDQVGKAVHKAGDSIQETAGKASRSSDAFTKVFSILSGLGIAAALANAAGRISKFFDDINKKADEAVQKAHQVQQAYDGLFEAAGAYDENSRKAIIQETESLLAKTGTSSQTGYPTIEAYRRQFKDTMSPSDYDSGLEAALSYTARHGGSATPELIQMMRGWGYNTAQQQKDMYLLIMGASEQSGLTDNEMIDLLGRSSPAARKAGWTPQQTVSILSTLASGEIGRNKTMRPAQILEEYAEDPQKALGKYPALSNIRQVIPVSAAADRAEEVDFQKTLEGRKNQVDAVNRKKATQVKSDAEYESLIREIGRGEQTNDALESPVEQGVMRYLADKLFIPPTHLEEFSAQRAWKKSLTGEEKRNYLKEYQKKHNIKYMPNPNEADYQQSESDYLTLYWDEMAPQKQYESLVQHEIGKQKTGGLTKQSWIDSLSPEQKQGIIGEGNARGLQGKEALDREWYGVAAPVSPQPSQIYNIHHHNDMHIHENPPDAGPRSGGGLY
jgi:hypothetical protein